MKRAQRGFTLVEILVALSVAALLLSLVYGAVRVGQRSVYALDKQTAHNEAMHIGWQFLHRAIAHAGPANDPKLSEDRNENRTGFLGAPDTLVFIADMPSYVGIGGLTRISLGVDDSGDRRQLLLSRERLDLEESPADADAPEQAVLVEHLDQLQIDYFGQSERGAAPAWTAFWDNPRNLPNLVRISVRPRDAAAWPVLIARPLKGTTAIDEGSLPDEGIEPDTDDGGFE